MMSMYAWVSSILGLYALCLSQLILCLSVYTMLTAVVESLFYLGLCYVAMDSLIKQYASR